MFVQVACSKCGKPFQVPPAQLGQTVPCPWCRELAVAVPVAGVEPLALPDDDARPPSPAPPSPLAARPRSAWPKLVAVAVLSLIMLAAAYFGSRFYRGVIPGFAWKRLDLPGGHCRIELPGPATEVEMPADPNSPITRVGKRFVSASSFTRIGGFVGWYELDPDRIAGARRPSGVIVWRIAGYELDPVRPGARPEDVLAAERERRKAETGWTVDGEAAAKFSGNDPNAKTDQEKYRNFDALEVRYSDGGRKYLEKYVFVTAGTKPKLYVFGIGGSGFDPDGPDAQRVTSSFWFDEKR